MNTEIDTTIPKWLQRAKDGSLPNIKSFRREKGAARRSPAPKEIDPVDEVIAAMEPALRAKVTEELTAGHLQRHWLLDRSTIRLFEQDMADKEARRQAGLDKLRALGEARRREKAEAPAKPTFGVGVSVKLLVKENPRKVGTKAHARFEEMRKYLSANENATVASLFAATSYRRDDLDWDLARKAIRTDIVSTAPEKKPSTVAKVPTQEKAMATGTGKARPTSVKSKAKKTTTKKGK